METDEPFILLQPQNKTQGLSLTSEVKRKKTPEEERERPVEEKEDRAERPAEEEEGKRRLEERRKGETERKKIEAADERWKGGNVLVIKATNSAKRDKVSRLFFFVLLSIVFFM